MLEPSFFNQDALSLAQALLGKIIYRYHQNHWLKATIIETEAYFLDDKASHASLGYTPKRKALFMAPGTLYMYYARGSDSLNVSANGKGNAVLIKSAFIEKEKNTESAIELMQAINPVKGSNKTRPVERLCAGQTLLCQSLSLKVPDWDGKTFTKKAFYIKDVGFRPKSIIQTTRLGIPKGRDEHLQYRFIDKAYSKHCTSNPLTKRGASEGKEYQIITL